MAVARPSSSDASASTARSTAALLFLLAIDALLPHPSHPHHLLHNRRRLPSRQSTVTAIPAAAALRRRRLLHRRPPGLSPERKRGTAAIVPIITVAAALCHCRLLRHRAPRTKRDPRRMKKELRHPSHRLPRLVASFAPITAFPAAPLPSPFADHRSHRLPHHHRRLSITDLPSPIRRCLLPITSHRSRRHLLPPALSSPPSPRRCHRSRITHGREARRDEGPKEGPSSIAVHSSSRLRDPQIGP